MKGSLKGSQLFIFTIQTSTMFSSFINSIWLIHWMFFWKFFFIDLTLNAIWGPTKPFNSTNYDWVNILRANTPTQKPCVYLLQLLRASHLSTWSVSQPFYPPKLLISSRLAGETSKSPKMPETLICNTLHVPLLIHFVSENMFPFYINEPVEFIFAVKRTEVCSVIFQAQCGKKVSKCYNIIYFFNLV